MDELSYRFYDEFIIYVPPEDIKIPLEEYISIYEDDYIF